MARPLRIEYPDAWYHVMNHGRRGERVFLEDRDYHAYIEVLVESVELWNVRITAYCLMPNHYHLLVQTPNANLSRCMRHINGIYTQRFNRSHQCDGQLFRGRYKSILVDADNYLLQLMRYIHRNPLRGGMVEKLDSYKWSSHQGYISNSKKWDWLHKEFALSLLSDDKRHQLRLYEEFVAGEDAKEITGIFEKRKLPSILGSQGFINWARGRFFEKKRHIEIPDSKSLAPGGEEIRQFVCRVYQVSEQDLLKSRRGRSNEARNVAIYLTRQLRGEGLDAICREYGLKKHSSASSAIERVRIQILKDRSFRNRLEELRRSIFKSQTET